MTPTEIVDSLIEAFKRRDLGYVLAQVAPDVVWQGPDLVPWGGRHVGPEGVKAFFASLAENFDLNALTIRDRLASGDKVVILGSFAGKGRKTGKPAGTNFGWVWQVEDGKVVSYESHFDTAAILSALA